MVFVLACGLAVGGARAEDGRGRVAGEVTSRDGARLPGVVLLLTSEVGGASTRLSTGSLGTFRSPELAPGTYEVRVWIEDRLQIAAPFTVVTAP
jgi:hypothetical protein